MRKRLTFGITIVLVLSACSWTQFRGNARRSGVNPYAPGVTAATLNSLTPAWTSANHGAQLDDVITRDGLAVFGGTTALWAVDLGTGGDAWHADRTLGHMSNGIAAATTWREKQSNRRRDEPDLDRHHPGDVVLPDQRGHRGSGPCDGRDIGV